MARNAHLLEPLPDQIPVTAHAAGPSFQSPIFQAHQRLPIEAGIPRPRRCVLVAVNCSRVVTNIARANDQHARIAQRLQAASHLNGFSMGQRFVETHLVNRYVRIRKKVDQDGPGTMVDASAVVEGAARDQLPCRFCLRGCARRRIRKASNSGWSPKKSSIFSGAMRFEIAVPSVSQCAETINTAFGRGSLLPRLFNACVKPLSRVAFIGAHGR